jgi:hypothetical protein
MLIRLVAALLLGSSLLPGWRPANNPLDTVVTYPPTAFASASTDFAVAVNGQPVFVEENRHISFAHFSFSGTATVTVTFKSVIRSFELAPLSYGIHPTVRGNAMTFALTVPRKLVVHDLNDPHPSRVTEPRLLIFADPLEEHAPPASGPGIINAVTEGVDNSGQTDVTKKVQSLIARASKVGGVLYFPAGTYTVVSLSMASNMTMYLAGGARVHTSNAGSSALTLLDFVNVKNVRVEGRGSLDGNGVYLRYGKGGPQNLRDIVRTDVADGCSLDGILLIDPSEFSVFIRRSSGWAISNVKLIDYENADLAPYAGVDGIDPDQSRDVLVDDALILSGDDAMSVKAADTVRFKTIGRIAYKNSVFFNTASGSSMDNSSIVTPVTLADVSWENIDVVGSLFGVTLIDTAPGSRLDHEYFKNIRHGPVYAALMEISSGPGSVSNIYFDQFDATGFGPNGKQGKYGNFILGGGPTHGVDGVAYNGFVVGGKLQTNPSNLRVNANVKNLSFTNAQPTIVTIAANPVYATRRPLTSATVTIGRSGSTRAALTIGYAIAGTGRAGVDYQPIPPSVTIPAGQSSASFSVTPIAGGSGVTTVRLELNSTPFDTRYMLGPQFEAVVTIGD